MFKIWCQSNKNTWPLIYLCRSPKGTKKAFLLCSSVSLYECPKREFLKQYSKAEGKTSRVCWQNLQEWVKVWRDLVKYVLYGWNNSCRNTGRTVCRFCEWPWGGTCSLERSSEALLNSFPGVSWHVRKLHEGLWLLWVIPRQEFEEITRCVWSHDTNQLCVPAVA